MSTTPRFEDVPLQEICGPRYVVAEIDDPEAIANNWRPGFYLTRMPPREAHQRLTNHFRTNPNIDGRAPQIDITGIPELF